MLEIKNQKTKTTACRENGRSADFTSGNFILGCSHKKGDTYDNPCSYCYVARFGRQKLYVNTNTDELLAECDKAIQDLPFPRVPNQVDEKYYLTSLVIQILICIGTTMIGFMCLIISRSIPS
jgi:hypothetical protein